ncbi:MAG: hypothetical protein JWL77_1869 [Chthonomonadaceae bacterium]|nr:hypothetical protein [Chthonomonadaceae bacterium]
MPTNNHSDNLFDGQAPLDDEQLWDLLSLYVDGEADPTQAAIVEQMLSSDPAYRRDFEFLMASSQTMHMVEEVAPPAKLREAVYAATTRRPTLAGWLQAAWGRATTPAFARYATLGGAFAAAAIGVALFWPRTPAVHPWGNFPPSVAVATPPPHANVPSTDSMHLSIPDILLPENAFTLALKPYDHKVLPPSTLPVNPNGVSDLHGTIVKNGLQAAPPPHTLQQHHLPKNNALRPDSGQQVASNPTGYPYRKEMDNDKIHGHPETIVPSKADFGPMVVINDDTPTTSPDNGTQVNARQHSDPDVTTIPSPAPEPQKTRVRVAALPPEDKQVLAEAVLRKNRIIQNNSYDRAIADNMQRHDGLTLYKGSF